VADEPKKPIGKPFPKGKSGNPGGRPTMDPELAAMLDEGLPEAFSTLMTVMKNPKAAANARVRAAEVWIERRLGKPTQAVEHSGPGGGPIAMASAFAVWCRSMSDAELDQLETLVGRAALAERGADDGDGGEGPPPGPGEPG
jgi:hypothetical protein